MGEVYPGGPLTGYWMVGLVAISFGAAAIGLSFCLRPAIEPSSKSIVKEKSETATDAFSETEEAELAAVCGDPVS